MIPKFRAWASGEKLMSDVEYINFASETVVLTDTMTMDCFNIADVELMQSTGLKDKNGVEIFEGDCFIKTFKTFRNIEIPTEKNEIQKSVGIVKFHEGAFQVHVVGQGYELLSQVVQLNFLRANIDHWEWGSVVVGNIYENPELLNLR